MGVFRLIFNRKPVTTTIKSVRRRVLLCGQEYSVKIEPGARNTTKIDQGVICMTLAHMTRENFESYFDTWYRRQSRKAFQASIDRWLVVMDRMGYFVDPPRIKVFEMSRAWGRCYYTKGLITLNSHLAKMPPQCIDYITLHELCHFLFNNHSSEFYGVMTRIEPLWRVWEQDLKLFAKQKGLTR